MTSTATASDALTTRNEQARDWLRMRLADVAGDYRDRPGTSRTAQVVRLARAAGLSTTEIERVSGLGRQTIYDLYRGERGAPSDDPRLETVALLGAIGLTTPETVASTLGLSAQAADQVLESLKLDGLVERSGAGHSSENFVWAYHLTPDADLALAEAVEFSERRSRHPEAWITYIQVKEDEKLRLLEAAQRICGRKGADIIEAHVSSTMAGPELAIFVRAVDQRQAFSTTHRLFAEIRRAAKLDAAAAVIAAFSAPNLSSLSTS